MAKREQLLWSPIPENDLARKENSFKEDESDPQEKGPCHGQERLTDDNPIVKVVMEIYNRLLTAPSTRGYRPNIRIYDDRAEKPTACMDASLTLHINIGLLMISKTPGQVASVLAHEIGHALAHHRAESYFHDSIDAYTQELKSSNRHDPTNNHKSIYDRALKAGLKAGGLAPEPLLLRRYHEYEADYVGIFIAAEAGFDPQNAIDSMQNMLLQETSEEKFSTDYDMKVHPTWPNRISALKPYLDEARKKMPNLKVDNTWLPRLERKWQEALTKIWKEVQFDADTADYAVRRNCSIFDDEQAKDTFEFIRQNMYPRIQAVTASLDDPLPQEPNSKIRLASNIAKVVEDGDRAALTEILHSLNLELWWAEKCLGADWEDGKFIEWVKGCLQIDWYTGGFVVWESKTYLRGSVEDKIDGLLRRVEALEYILVLKELGMELGFDVPRV